MLRVYDLVSPSLVAVLGPATALLALLVVLGAGSSAGESRSKFGPDAIPIQQFHEFIQTHRAPDYWTLSAFYVPQLTSSSCSVAAISMLVNALRGVPASDEVPLVTQNALIAAVGDQRWGTATMENGSGVTWGEFEHYVLNSIKAFGIAADLEVFKPANDSESMLQHLRTILTHNEESDRDVVLVYFNQGVLTGSWDGPHISPIAAYDAERRRVLIMDVDREWYIPYWVSEAKLLQSMLQPAPPTRGVLAGQTGGMIRVERKPAP